MPVKKFDAYEANVLFLYPLKTENQSLSDVFIEYRNRILAQNEFIE